MYYARNIMLAGAALPLYVWSLLFVPFLLLMWLLPLVSSPEQTAVVHFVMNAQDTLTHFTAQEVAHLLEVRTLIGSINTITAVVLFFSALMFYAQCSKKRLLLMTLRAAAHGCLLSALLCGILIVFFFEPIFIQFHEVLFLFGNWSFFADARIIQLFPESFFLSFTSVWIMTVMIFCGVIMHYTKSVLAHAQN